MGQVGDIIAGPTETCCLADEDADVNLIATDLVGQAEHGHDSPAVLVTTSRHVAEQVLALIPEKIASLQENQPRQQLQLLGDYGEIIVASTREEMCVISDEIASEYLQVHCRRERAGITRGYATMALCSWGGDKRIVWGQMQDRTMFCLTPTLFRWVERTPS